MKNNSIFKALGFAIGACTAFVAFKAIKKRMDEEKQREAEIEAEITAILEQKFAENDAADAAGEE